MTYLNLSRISLGALVLIVIIYFTDPVTRSQLGGLPVSWRIGLTLLIAVLVILTSYEKSSGIINFIIGVLIVIVAYQFPDVQTAFVDGRIVLVIIFLLLITIYMKRAIRFDF